MNKLRILFVDDDPSILSGLKRMLYRNRDRWELGFAAGGRAALDLLHDRPADIVISDMRMPQMDGQELLEQIKTTFPQIVRGILSGQAEKNQTLQVIGTTHFYLSKPCHPKTLRNVIERVGLVLTWLPDDELRQRVLQLKSVPSDPRILESVRSALAKEPVDLDLVGELAAGDVGLTAKILQLVCTSFLGKPHYDCDARLAVRILGTRLFSELLQTDGFATTFTQGEPAFSLEHFFRQSQLIAELARKIARRESEPLEVQLASYNAGWLRGVGQLIFSVIHPEKYRHLLQQQKTGNRSLPQLEHDCLGCTHADVGGFLLGVWGLPDPVCRAVGTYLNQPDPQLTNEGFSPTTAVQAATILIEELPESAGQFNSMMNSDLIASLKRSQADKFDQWSRLIIE